MVFFSDVILLMQTCIDRQAAQSATILRFATKNCMLRVFLFGEVPALLGSVATTLPQLMPSYYQWISIYAILRTNYLALLI